MSSRCPFVYVEGGLRFQSGDVRVRIEGPNGVEVVRVATDVPPGRHERGGEVLVSPSYLAEEGFIDAFVLAGGVEVEVTFDPRRSSGKSGRRKVDGDVFEQVRATYGEDTARAYARMALEALPGQKEGRGVGESRAWMKSVVEAAGGVHEKGVLGVLREHQHAYLAYSASRARLGAAEIEQRVEAWLADRAAVRSAGERGQSRGAVRSTARMAAGGYDGWVEALRESDPGVSRAMLNQIGSRLSGRLLESYARHHEDQVVRAAAVSKLREVNPDAARVVAMGVLAEYVRNPEVVGTRLVEAAIPALDAGMQERLALDSKAEWLVRVNALGALDDTRDETFKKAALDRGAHPLVRIAATARVKDSEALVELSRDRDVRVSETALRRRDVGYQSERAEARPRIMEVMTHSGESVKLAGCDLDGTLLDERGRVVERNAEGVRKFADAGGVVCFVTTRSMETAISRAREALDGRDGVLVCDDGMTVCDVQTGALLRDTTPNHDAIPAGWAVRGREVRCEESEVGGFKSAEVARALSGDGGVLEVTKSGSVRYSTEKAETLQYVCGLVGVELSECVVFGDGKVDCGMFEKVTNAGGIAVAVANAQPGVIDHRAVGMVCASNEQGGVGDVLVALSEGSLPHLMRDASTGLEQRRPKREVYSQYLVEDGAEIRAQLEEAGLGRLVQVEPGFSHHGGTPGAPGHITYAHPNDWRGREMPSIKDGDVSIVGYVEHPDLTAVVCAVDQGDGPSSTREDGKTFHVTLRTRVGLPPKHSNDVIVDGWTRLEKPIPIRTVAVESSKAPRR